MIEVALQLQKGHFQLDASFRVAATGVTGVFGRSGCGKTSLLRALAGLEPAARGTVRLRGQVWQESGRTLPVAQRRVGFVFQDASLFPHMTAIENLQYARKRVDNGAHQIDLNIVSEILELQDLLHREASSLSGGERQRVAIGRALLGAPQLLLMDEPLSALDQSARRKLMSVLENIFQQFEMPVFYVSHSSDEIARLADNLILMDKGRVSVAGELNSVLGQVDSPLNETDEAFSVLQCHVVSHQLPYLTTVQSKGGETLYVPRGDLQPGSTLRLRVRARDVSLCLSRPNDSSILNILAAKVLAVAHEVEQGSRTVKLDIAGESLLAKVSEHSAQQLNVVPGQTLFAQVKSVSFLF